MTQNYGLTALAMAAVIGAGATVASAADLYKPTVAPAQATLVPAASASSFFIHAGVAGVFFSPGAYITAGGAGRPERRNQGRPECRGHRRHRLLLPAELVGLADGCQPADG